MGFFGRLKKVAKKGNKILEKGRMAHDRYQDRRLQNLKRESMIIKQKAIIAKQKAQIAKSRSESMQARQISNPFGGMNNDPFAGSFGKNPMMKKKMRENKRSIRIDL